MTKTSRIASIVFEKSVELTIVFFLKNKTHFLILIKVSRELCLVRAGVHREIDEKSQTSRFWLRYSKKWCFREETNEEMTDVLLLFILFYCISSFPSLNRTLRRKGEKADPQDPRFQDLPFPPCFDVLRVRLMCKIKSSKRNISHLLITRRESSGKQRKPSSNGTKISSRSETIIICGWPNVF